jgi:hypothetical protein
MGLGQQVGFAARKRRLLAGRYIFEYRARWGYHRQAQGYKVAEPPLTKA